MRYWIYALCFMSIVFFLIMTIHVYVTKSSKVISHFFVAVKTNDVKQVKRYVMALPNINVKDSDGKTALMIASGLWEVEIVNLLLAHGADVNVLDNVMGVSTLHLAAQGGSVDVAKLLLQQGAFVNLQIPANGLTPLMNAVWHRNVAMVAFLLNQPNINVEIRSYFGATAEDLVNPNKVIETKIYEKMPTDAATVAMQKLFIDHNKKQQEYLKEHPLLVLVQEYAAHKNSETLQKIKEAIRDGTDVNAKTKIDNSGNAGHTALMMASRDGLNDVVELLLKSGADMSITDSYMHATPLHKAAYMGHADVIKTLAQKQLDFSKIINNQGPINGYTALHDAVWHDNFEATKVLLQQNANPNLKGLDGYTPLDLAKKYGYTDIIQLLGKNE